MTTPNQDHAPRATADEEDEKKPFNNSMESGQTDDVRYRGKKTDGCFVSTALALFLFLLALFLIVITATVTGYLTKLACQREYAEAGVAAVSSNYSRTDRPRPASTIPPSLPWSGIRLPRAIIPSDYTLSLTIDLDQFIFTGSVEINVEVAETTKYIVLHANLLTINSSANYVIDLDTSEDQKIAHTKEVPQNQFYVIEMQQELGRDRKYRIVLSDFRGRLLDDLRGLYRSTYIDKEGRKRYLAATQLQAVDARKVLPCFDEPDLKAKFTVSITHSNDYVALSNMPNVQEVDLGNGWVRDTFKETPRMSTYLLAMVVADFRSRERESDGLLVRIWSQPDMYDQTQHALDFAIEAHKFFARYFSIPEEVPKSDQVAIPDFSAGAMENWGLVLYRETALLHSDEYSSISNQYWVSLVMAHEIAHTWFGNMVTMRWWDDLWLNEGFANILMYIALDDIYEEWNVFDLQLVDNVYPVMTKDSLLTSHAISTPISDPLDIPQFFDSISYDKGMAVLRLLRSFLGWDDFKAGLRRYIRKYQFSNAEMHELWATFSQSTNNKYDVAKIMDTWTRQMGFPVVTVRRLRGNTYILEQERFLLNPDDTYDVNSSPYQYKWDIPFRYQIQNEKDVGIVWMNRSSAEIDIPDGSWLVGNVHYWGFFRTNYEEAMWKLITEQLRKNHTVFSAANRAGFINDAFNLARANKLRYSLALNLTLYLHQERDYIPWRAFLDSMHFMQGMLSTSNCYGTLKKYIFSLVAPQYRRVGVSDQGGLLERLLRRILLESATSVGVPDAVDWGHRQFQNWMEYGSKIPADYSVVIYSVGIRMGGEAAWDFMWQKANETQVTSEAEEMKHALATTLEPWLMWRLVRWTLDSSKVRMQDVRNFFQYFSDTALGRSVALDFMLTNWDEINTRFADDPYLIRDVLYATTSQVNTDFEYSQLRDLYKTRPPAGMARLAAENSLALIRSNIKWRKLHYSTIERWLEAYQVTLDSDNT